MFCVFLKKESVHVPLITILLTKPNISLSFGLVATSDLKAALSFWSSFQSLQFVMNHKVNYGLIKSKVQIRTRNTTRCNNHDDLLHLSFTLKISIFLEAYK